MIATWLLILVVSIGLFIFIKVINATIDSTSWPTWVKEFTKAGVWISAVVGFVLFLFAVAILTGSSGNNNSKK